LVTLAIFTYFIRWLYDVEGVLPRESLWLIDALILILALRTLVFSHRRHEKTTLQERLIYVLIAFGLLSALLNGVDKAATLAGMRLGFRYLLLFIASYHMDIPLNWLKKYWIFLFVIGLVQTPIAIYQSSISEWSTGDIMSGSFGLGQTPGVALFLLALFTYMMARMLEDGRIRVTFLMIIVWMSVAPILGEAKFYFMFMPLLMFFMVRTEVFRRPVVAIALVGLGGLLLVTVDFVILRTGAWAEGRNPLTFIQHLPEYYQHDVEMGDAGRYDRGYQIATALRFVTGSGRIAVIGNGPGSITDSYVAEGRSRTLSYYARYGLTSSQCMPAIWLLLEYGVTGMVMIFLLLYLIYRRGRILRASDNPEFRVYGRILEGLTFTYTAWLFYQAAWQSDAMAFIYWPMAGILVRYSYLEAARKKQAALATPSLPSLPSGSFNTSSPAGA
jgi:hypothetical protein